MVNDVESVVAWEALTAKGLPLSISGILLRDGQPIDTVRTSAYGIGSFKLKPDPGSRYALVVKANHYLKKDTIYQLPQAMKEGIVLRLDQAVVNDTLVISLASKRDRAMQVIIHSNNKALASFEVNASPKGSKVTIALPGMLKGIGIVTVVDELGRPVAERLFFGHFNQKIKAGIITSKAGYGRKEKVNVKIRLSDQDNRPVQGVISIAAVQANRIEGDKFQDIATYAYLVNSVGKIPRDPLGPGLDNRDYIEDILLIKGWREYTWQKLMNSAAEDEMIAVAPEFTGSVKFLDKVLKKPVSLGILRDSLISMATTKTDGSFILTEDQLITSEGRKVFATVSVKNNEGYTIEMDNPFLKAGESFSKQLIINYGGIALTGQSTADNQLAGIGRMTALQEVIVRAGDNDQSIYGSGTNVNACGDYVCLSNILNCRNHLNSRLNKIPVAGQQYIIDPQDPERRTIFYPGCLAENKPGFLKLKGIYTARDFYDIGQDVQSLQEPQFLSTLTWKPGIVTDENGLAEFDFYTGDITGNFRIIVQGIGQQGVVSGQQEFVVK